MLYGTNRGLKTVIIVNRGLTTIIIENAADSPDQGASGTPKNQKTTGVF
jgi:hypothetical protein